ncbi:hypothetical protein [Aureisphaera sp.]
MKFSRNETLSISSFVAILSEKPWTPILLFLGLAICNWLFEIAKWWTLSNTLEQLSFAEAAKQSLTSHTVSLATPNRIGEYGAKAYFFERKKRKRVLLLNLFSNLNQMFVTLVMGIVGMVILLQGDTITFSVTKIVMLLLAVLALIILGYLFKESALVVKGLTFSNVAKYFRNLAAIVKTKTLLFSVIRYTSFGTLFFLLLNYFNAGLDIETAFPLIITMYLFVSVIPSFLVLDVVIRGGVAIWLFSLAGVNEVTVVCAVMASWFLNFVLPALLGSPYVLTYKTA